MESHCIPLAEIPHTSKLFSDFSGEFGRVRSFYAHAPTTEAARAAAGAVALTGETRAAVVEVLREQNRRFGADAAVLANLDRLAAGAVAVVTGQQVGLFSGPAYSFYKAVTAIAVAHRLSESGCAAVPVFWLATEDHDLAEVNHCLLPGRDGLERIELPGDHGSARRVGEVQLGPEVVRAVESAARLLEGPGADEVAEALAAAYQPQETYGSAFAKLFARLLAGRGLILLDPLDARLHRLAAPLYRRALEGHDALTRDLLARNKALEKAGYHAQVKVAERSTLLFFHADGQRRPLRARNDGFVAGRATFSADELLAQLEAAPERFSGNVLLRPVVQDALLPTAAYIAGPAEAAYFAQAEAVYRRLGVRMPAVLPRAGFTLVPPPVGRLLKRYGLSPEDLFRGRQHVRARMERQFLSHSLGRQFDAGEKSLRSLLSKLRGPLGKLDPTLLGALDTAEKKMLYQYLKLRAKAGRAENLRTGVLDRHERLLTDFLYPRHGLQERSLCLLAFLAQQGGELLDALEARVPGAGSSACPAASHQVLYL